MFINEITMQNHQTKILRLITYMLMLAIGTTVYAASLTEEPVGLAFDKVGNLFVLDKYGVQKVSADSVCQLIAKANPYMSVHGGGVFAIDKDLSQIICFENPTSIVITANNEIMVSDTGSPNVRIITTTGTFGAPGNICSLSTLSSGGYWIDGMCLDSEGTLYAAESFYNRILCFPSSSASSPRHGVSGLNAPTAVLVDNAGHMYIAETGNHMIRSIAANGTVLYYAGKSGVSGTSDGFVTQARFNNPKGMTFDGDDNIYVADKGNSTIRMITWDGEVFTIAGQAGVTGLKDGNKQNALFNHPTDVEYDSKGYLYVADTGNSAIRKIQLSTGQVTTLVLRRPNDSSSGNNGNQSGGDSGGGGGGSVSYYYILTFGILLICRVCRGGRRQRS